MICYKDKTYCYSDCTNDTCPRFIYDSLWYEAKGFGLWLSVSDFSEDCTYYRKG